MCYDYFVQKGFAPLFILVGILILGVIGGGIYYLGKSATTKPLSQNPIVSQATQLTSTPLPSETSVKEGDETASWQTYTNDALGIKFSYPPVYSYKDTCADVQEPFFICGYLKDSSGHAVVATMAMTDDANLCGMTGSLLLPKDPRPTTEFGVAEAQARCFCWATGFEKKGSSEVSCSTAGHEQILTNNNQKGYGFTLQEDRRYHNNLPTETRELNFISYFFPKKIMVSKRGYGNMTGIIFRLEDQSRTKDFDQILSTFKFIN